MKNKKKLILAISLFVIALVIVFAGGARFVKSNVEQNTIFSLEMFDGFDYELCDEDSDLPHQARLFYCMKELTIVLIQEKCMIDQSLRPHHQDMFHERGYFPLIEIDQKFESARNRYRENCMRIYNELPAIPVREYTSRHRTRTIHFKFANGTRAHDSIVQTAHFGTVRDLFSNQERITDDSVTLSSLPIPSVSYPTGQYTVLSPRESEIPEMILTLDSMNEELTIIFPLLEYEGDVIVEDPPVVETPERERPSIPDTLASIPLYVYITAGVFILIGIIVFIKGRKKEEELEII